MTISSMMAVVARALVNWLKSITVTESIWSVLRLNTSIGDTSRITNYCREVERDGGKGYDVREMEEVA